MVPNLTHKRGLHLNWSSIIEFALAQVVLIALASIKLKSRDKIIHDEINEKLIESQQKLVKAEITLEVGSLLDRRLKEIDQRLTSIERKIFHATNI